MSKKDNNEVSERRNERVPILNIIGVKVALGPFHPGLVAHMHRWLNDFAITALSGDPIKPRTLEEAQMDYLRDCSGERRDYRGFCIYERASLRLIGITELRRISLEDGTATYSILIGEKDCWDNGYGTETTRLVLDYGFNMLGLRNIMLTTASNNERAIHAYTRAGFRLIGRRRETYRQGPHFYDEIMMDCLSTEFLATMPSSVR
jgi:RimJ/RimL family protein N-acetyltransferase